MTTKREQIVAKAIELLSGAPEGIRYSELVRKIATALPEIPKNTIHGTVWNLEVKMPDEIYKPARGLLLHVQFREGQSRETQKPVSAPVERIREELFYEPFADWLVNELEECTKAIRVGSNLFKDK